MGKGSEGPSRYFVWTVFFAVFLVHLFLAKAWFGEHFVCDFMNSHSFLDALSGAYQKVVGLQSRWFDFSVFRGLPETRVGEYWPPLPSMIGLWTLLLLPLDWFFLQNFIYLAAIMLGIYFSAKRLCGDHFYSMLAAVIFSCYWLVNVQLVSYEVQLAATACIVWGFYGYLRSCFFTRFWPSLGMGLFTALGLYFDRLAPVLFLFALFLIPENFRTKRSCLLMGMVLVLVVICVWPFYAGWVKGQWRSGELFFSLSADRSPPADVYRAVLHNPRFLWAHLSYYLVSLPERLLGYGFTGLLVLGIFFLPRLKKPYARVLGTALGVPLLVFMGVIKKQYVYIFPLCIYFAIISALGIFFVRQKAVRYALMGLIACLTAVQYYLFFVSPRPESTLFFSHRYEAFRDQGVPRLVLYEDGSRKNSLKEIFSVVSQLRDLLPQFLVSGTQHSKLIVDLQRQDLQFSVVFFLRLLFPKTEVINVTLFRPLFCGDPGPAFSYLLSDKEKYAGSAPPKSVAGCSWESIRPEHRLAVGDLVLYRVER